MTQTKRIAVFICLLQTATTTLTAGGFWFSIGPAYRGGMKAKTTGTTYSQMVARTEPRTDFEDPDWAWPASIDYNYYDGYVSPVPVPGWWTAPTWNWGYDNSDQYDPADGTLTFHGRSSHNSGGGYAHVREPSAIRDIPTALSSAFDGLGLDCTVGYPWIVRPVCYIDMCAGLATIWDARATKSGTTFEEHVVQRKYEFYNINPHTAVYDVSGITVPDAPYRGSPAGPTIPYAPLYRESWRETVSTLISQREWTNRNHIDIASDTDIYSLWLGPRIYAQVLDNVNVHITPRLSVNLVDVGVSRYETLTRSYEGGDTMTLHSWSDHGSKTDTLFGAGVTAGMDWESARGFFAGIQGGYEWVGDDVKVDVGPNTVSIDISGYTASAVAGIRFGGE